MMKYFFFEGKMKKYLELYFKINYTNEFFIRNFP